MSGYKLNIAEDNGEIEEELSSLEETTLVGRFGFTHLALIERDDANKPSNSADCDNSLPLSLSSSLLTTQSSTSSSNSGHAMNKIQAFM